MKYLIIVALAMFSAPLLAGQLELFDHCEASFDRMDDLRKQHTRLSEYIASDLSYMDSQNDRIDRANRRMEKLDYEMSFMVNVDPTKSEAGAYNKKVDQFNQARRNALDASANWDDYNSDRKKKLKRLNRTVDKYEKVQADVKKKCTGSWNVETTNQRCPDSNSMLCGFLELN